MNAMPRSLLAVFVIAWATFGPQAEGATPLAMRLTTDSRVLKWDDGKPVHVISITVNHTGLEQNATLHVDGHRGTTSR